VIADVRADLTDAAAIAVTDDPSQTIAMPASFRSDAATGWNRRDHRAHRNVRHSRASSAHGKSKPSASKSKASASKSKAKSSPHKAVASKKSSTHKKKAA
jgi:hypothetical protein